jgi:uncharacterized membrane protein
MKHLLSKDLGIIFLLTTIYVIVVSFPNFHYQYPLDLIFFLISFLFTGYSLIALIRPEESYREILRKPVLILEFSVLITLAVSVLIKFSYLGLHIRTLVMVLAILIMTFSIAAYIRRINYFKTHDRLKIAHPKKSEPPMQQPPIKSESPKSPNQKQLQNNRLIFNIDILGIEILCVFVLLSYFIKILNSSVLHFYLGLLFMLFLSGYTIGYIIFPRKDELSTRIRILISIGISFPITSIVGLPLYYTSYGLSTSTILFPLTILTMIFGVFAYKRKLIALRIKTKI